MKSFKDAAGRTWTPAINVDVVKRVRTRLEGLDLLALFEENATLIGRLMNDPIVLADVLYVVCEPEAKAANVSDEEFGRGLAGDCIADATAALLDNLIDFFPSQRRVVLKKAFQKLTDLQTRLAQRAEALLESPALEKKLTELMDRDTLPASLWRMIWNLAGEASVLPGPLTMAELFLLAEGRSREQWRHTAALLCSQANANRDPKQRPYAPRQFNPWLLAEKEKPLPGNILMLKTVFVDGQVPACLNP